MLKEHLDYYNISIYKLAKEADVPYSTVNDLVNRKVDIDYINYKTVKRLAQYFGYSSDQFYLMCNDDNYVFHDDFYGKVYFKRSKPYMEIYDHENKVLYDIRLEDFKEHNDKFLLDYGRYALELKSKELKEKEIVERMNRK